MPKKRAQPDSSADYSGRKKVTRTQLRKWTKAQLKSACRREGLATGSSTKATLIDSYLNKIHSHENDSENDMKTKPAKTSPKIRRHRRNSGSGTNHARRASNTAQSPVRRRRSSSLRSPIRRKPTQERNKSKTDDSSDSMDSSSDKDSLGSSVRQKLAPLKLPMVTDPLRNFVEGLQKRGYLPTQQNFDDAWSQITNLRSDVAAKLPSHTTADFLQVGSRISSVREHVMDQIRTSMGDRYQFFSWAYISRLLAALAFFVFTGYINACCSAAAGWRTPYIHILDISTGEVQKHYALPDIGFDAVSWVSRVLLPDSWIKDDSLDWNDGPNVVMGVHVVLLLIFLVLSPQRFKVIRRLVVVYSFLNLLRAFCVIATSIPDPHPVCHNQFSTPDGAYKTTPMFPAVFYRGFKAMTGHTTCGDCIFSGHSTLMLIVMKTYTEYFHSFKLHCRVSVRHASWVRAWMRVFTSISLLVVLSTRFHYTLDIAIAIFLTLRVWDSYHLHTRTLALRESVKDTLMDVLMWFEAEEIIQLEHQVYNNMADTVMIEKAQAVEVMHRQLTPASQGSPAHTKTM